MRAIAAMSRNRVIGRGDAIPWRISDELKWFRRTTFGHVVVMGRRTFESLPRPLDGRVNVVLTREPERLRTADARYAHALVGAAAHRVPDVTQPTLPRVPEVRLVRALDTLARAGVTREAWLAGGEQVYAQFLPECSELLLSVIDREVEGDVSFPPFEHLFEPVGLVAEFAEFRVHRWVRRAASAP
jgi:dihydrofolate reductase